MRRTNVRAILVGAGALSCFTACGTADKRAGDSARASATPMQGSSVSAQMPPLLCARAESLAAGALWFSSAERSMKGWTPGGWQIALAPEPDTLPPDSLPRYPFGQGAPTAARVAGRWWAVIDTVSADAPRTSDAPPEPDSLRRREGKMLLSDTFEVAWNAPQPTGMQSITLRHRNDTTRILDVRLDCNEATFHWGTDTLHFARRRESDT